MRRACLEVDSEIVGSLSVERQKRFLPLGSYRLPSLGYPVFDANTNPRQRLDHLFHRRLIQEREQDRSWGQKGVKVRIISESDFEDTSTSIIQTMNIIRCIRAIEILSFLFQKPSNSSIPNMHLDIYENIDKNYSSMKTLWQR